MRPDIQYCRDVIDGRILSGKWTQLACRRHLSDLEYGGKRGLVFDKEAADRVIRFFDFLRHSKGRKFAGRPFILELWQKWIVSCLFGWKMEETGFRRFRTAIISVARKNGKTTLAAGLGLYMLDGDSEPGAECYSAATKRDQAKISWSAAVSMVKASPQLRKRLTPYRDELRVASTESAFVPLGKDADSSDGLNVHLGLCDELHQWPDGSLWDSLNTGTGSREQSLMLGITTRGHDPTGFYGELDTYIQQILEGIIEDDRFFGVIYALDEGDQWDDERSWEKANPNLGISVDRDDFRVKCREAKQITTRQNEFKRKKCNLWTQSEEGWIPHDIWMRNVERLDIDSLAGQACYGGLDLSATTDLTAFVLVFPPGSPGERYVALCKFFLPETDLADREKRDKAPYGLWASQELLTLTPGAAVDHAVIIAEILELSHLYDLREIGFDSWNISGTAQRLEAEGFRIREDRQTFKTLSPPAKELERLAFSDMLNHLGNPILSWNMANVVISRDPADNIRPDKGKSRKRIDGVIALIMALSGATIHDLFGEICLPEILEN